MMAKKTTSAVWWFTGLSGSGKSTIAEALKKRLQAFGKKVHLVDADDIRAAYPQPLGFSREDIRENNRRHACLAWEMMSSFDDIIVAIISPYEEDREMVRRIIGPTFRLVYASTPLEICIARDTKGLYAKAARREMDDLIGAPNSKIPYEPPASADVEVDTSRLSIEEAVDKIIRFGK
jgi:adenylyl-sulfate kinase